MEAVKRTEEPIGKVLAVDDELEILRLYDLFLQDQGYEFHGVSDAEQCMKYLRENPPDIILLDVNMPGIDGLRLLEMIRVSENGKTLPIIMISARRDENTILEAAKLGCDSFVVKPFRLEELSQRIASELVSVDLAFVRKALPILRMPRYGILRQLGLSAIDVRHWDCYPFRQDGLEFCAIIPLGMRPQALLKNEDAIREKVRIFYKHKMRWRQVWPK